MGVGGPAGGVKAGDHQGAFLQRVASAHDRNDNRAMREPNFRQVAIGAALLLMSCGGGSGHTGTAGNGGGGRAGSGAGGQTGSTDGGGASCVAVPACGGNIVGNWRATQSCVTATRDLSSVCPGATAEIELVIGGTVTYNSDGTYSSMPTGGTATFHEHFPNGCMPFGQTCDQFGQTLVDGGAMISGSCSTDGAGVCNCDAMGPETATNQTGTYVTSGGTLTLMHDGMTSTAPYCVQGGMLYEMAGPGDGGVITMGGIVFAKQ
jgi:hypothetical protein